MLARPLLYLLFAVLVATGAYWVAVISLGGLRDNPFRRLVVAPTWPLPADAAAHPFWARFPDLRSADYDKQHAAWQTLLAYDRTELPHPAAKPAAWPLADRIFAHALLWRLWRGKSYRAGSLELRLDREEDAPPLQPGVPARLRLTVVPTAGTGRPRFPQWFRVLAEAGGRLHWFTAPPGGIGPTRHAPFGEAPRFEDFPPRDAAPVAVRRPFRMREGVLATIAINNAGRHTAWVIVDLTNVTLEDSRVPRGLWVTNPFVLDVAPIERR